MTKNIYILPTKNREISNIGIVNNKLHISKIKEFGLNPQNIYITNNEEIKGGDWAYHSNQKNVIKIYGSESKLMKGHIYLKKIILTTDTDLIKDGVQAIPDDFLEWFVKNPSCEEVEVVKSKFTEYNGNVFIGYKIIIQKKNFYCGDEVDYGEKCEFQCEGCNDATGVDYGFLPQEKVEHKGNVLTTEEVMEGRSNAYEFIDFEEVINEAAVKWIRQPKLISQKESFIAGVKWAQKELYTKEDMLEAFNAGNKRGHSGYPNTDNWTQPTFEDFLRKIKGVKPETKTE